MLVDLLLHGEKVLVVGGGRVGERKVLQLLDAGADITVVSEVFSDGLLALSGVGRVKLEEMRVKEGFTSSLAFKPKVAILALDDNRLNRKLAQEVRSAGALVCVVDDPSISDFSVPAIAKVGDIRIGVSTGGSSPAMAGVIRRRVERLITRKDVLQVELQKYVRTFAKTHIRSHEERGKALHRIIDDEVVNRFLEEGNLEGAREVAEKIIIQAGREEGGVS